MHWNISRSTINIWTLVLGLDIHNALLLPVGCCVHVMDTATYLQGSLRIASICISTCKSESLYFSNGMLTSWTSFILVNCSFWFKGPPIQIDPLLDGKFSIKYNKPSSTCISFCVCVRGILRNRNTSVTITRAWRVPWLVICVEQHNLGLCYLQVIKTHKISIILISIFIPLFVKT